MEIEGFTKVFESEFARCYVAPERGIVLCNMKVGYVPILNFKETFHVLAEEVMKGGFTKFVFDKSSLKTFHQPSMKWYFTEWKTKMLEYGLHKHFKVLPEIDWFKKSVEAARKPLLKQFPDEVLSKLRIEYFDTVQQAIDAE
jgi:hypothetical protein